MADSRIGIKVTGSADLSALQRELQKTERDADKLRKQIDSAGGGVSQLGKAGQGLQRMLQGGLSPFVSAIGGAVGGSAMYGQVQGGLQRYKEQVLLLDQEARTVKRLGERYRDYQTQINEVGKAYGYTTRELTALASLQNDVLGRAGADDLTDNLQLQQGFGRAYGMSAAESGDYFAQSQRAGITAGAGQDVSQREFAALIASAVVAGNMQGREREVIQSMTGLTQAINRQRVDVAGTEIAGEALATLNATGVRGLQGEQGAGLLQQMNNAIMNPGGGEAGTLFMYQALTGGHGGMNLADFQYLQEEGLAGVGPTGNTNLQQVMETVNDLPIAGRYRTMAAAQLTGMSMHQYEALEGAFMRDGEFQTAKIDGLHERLGPDGLQNVDSSVWGLLAELTSGDADTGAVANEFEAITGVAPTSTTDRDALFDQIAGFGTTDVALSEGQAREKLDSDLAKAAEDAGANLYAFDTALTEATKGLLELTGSLPGPLGGIAPVIGGAAMGAGISGGMSFIGNQAMRGLGGLFGGGGATAVGGNVAQTAAATTNAGFMSAAGTILGGVGMGLGSAAAGAGIAEHGLGTVGVDVALPAAQAGARDVISGDVDMRDVGSAAGSVLASPFAVLAGVGTGLGYMASGGSFRGGYNEGFFETNRFDSPGRRQNEQIEKAATAAGYQGEGSEVLAQAQRLNTAPEMVLAMLHYSGYAPGSAKAFGDYVASERDAGESLFDAVAPGDAAYQHAVMQLAQDYGQIIYSARGGWLNVPGDDMPTMLHRQEMVLPAALATTMRDLMTRATQPDPDETVALAAQAREQAIRITIDPITITFPDGSTQTVQAEARADPFGNIIDHAYATTGPR